MLVGAHISAHVKPLHILFGLEPDIVVQILGLLVFRNPPHGDDKSQKLLVCL